METPNTSSLDYKYGIYAKIANKAWNTEQIKMYFENKGYPYEESWGTEELVEELKKWQK